MSSHVPAWKRLGLKLKGPASGEAIPSSGSPSVEPKPSPPIPNAHQTRTANQSPASALKRKIPNSVSTSETASSAQTPNKKQRREDASATQGTPSSLRKSVSFADGTKEDAAAKLSEKKPKKKATKKTAVASNTDVSLEPSLNYLRQWHTARESWKFNKNHQTLLIKYLFDQDKIPSSDIFIFYQYIRDLKGFVRTRLRETAAEIKQKDMEAGPGAFPATLKDKETKQKEYDETTARFLQDLHQHQQQHNHQPNGGKKPPKNANGKRTLEEVEYVLRIATPEVKHRLLKRIRAERVLDELSSSDSEENTTSTVSAGTTTSTTTSGGSSSAASAGQEPAAATVNGVATRGRSDSSQQPAKRRRLRNVRTDIGDDDSSSSDSSASESDEESSSSSSESDDGSEDTEMLEAAAGASSSSSSSSSSELESGSEPGGGTTEQESEEDDDSSDDD
ncbi:hypothetical protein N658DRAFT_492569 [Parathielavia hyrcaniae]|uniref:WKF domain-containing protein n=1 Tax=Parathielavia hyrcaniae TaxID=113614 RepID=A0AAN6T455_9PEZI|nr:hypothetical protein N658DRAFT_492569 [Parathielavia hyrcaniae]